MLSKDSPDWVRLEYRQQYWREIAALEDRSGG